MRYVTFMLLFAALAGAAEFLHPKTGDYVRYDQILEVVLKLDKPLLEGRIGWGRGDNEAKLNILSSPPIHAYGDTLRVTVTLRGLAVDNPADRYYKGWIRMYLFNGIGGRLATVAVQTIDPPPPPLVDTLPPPPPLDTVQPVPVGVLRTGRGAGAAGREMPGKGLPDLLGRLP